MSNKFACNITMCFCGELQDFLFCDVQRFSRNFKRCTAAWQWPGGKSKYQVMNFTVGYVIYVAFLLIIS